jgi:hypothetical protein
MGNDLSGYDGMWNTVSYSSGLVQISTEILIFVEKAVKYGYV